MRRVLLLLVICGLTAKAYGQFSFGPRVAITQNKLNISNADAGVEELGFTTGYQLGFFLRSDIPGMQVSIQPEFLYSQSELKFSLQGDNYALEIDRIELPILLMTEVGPLRLQAGPSFGIIAEVMRRQPNGSVAFIRNNYEPFTMGYQLGVGIDVKAFVFDLRYGEDVNVIGSELDRGLRGNQRQKQITLALGFKLL